MDVLVKVYELTSEFPKHELYGMTQQIRRAACSIPANIAEGFGRGGSKEFKLFLSYSRGSLLEVETYLQAAVRLEFISRADAPCCGNNFKNWAKCCQD